MLQYSEDSSVEVNQMTTAEPRTVWKCSPNMVENLMITLAREAKIMFVKKRTAFPNNPLLYRLFLDYDTFFYI